VLKWIAALSQIASKRSSKDALLDLTYRGDVVLDPYVVLRRFEAANGHQGGARDRLIVADAEAI
jgi:hypothetical protein